MRTVVIESAHQRRHFEFFRAMNHPHFSVCAPVEVGPYLAAARARQLRITPALVYLLARAANAVPQLRQRIRGEQLVEHAQVHPSFSVRTDEAEVFSFCEVPFELDAAAFVACATRRMEERRLDPHFADDPQRDDYLFLSAFPWAAFTAVQHAMHYHPHDCVPRITWGKLERDGERTRMALAIQAHHAVVDGIHLGRFFEQVEGLVGDAATTLDTRG